MAMSGFGCAYQFFRFFSYCSVADGCNCACSDKVVVCVDLVRALPRESTIGQVHPESDREGNGPPDPVREHDYGVHPKHVTEPLAT